MILDIINSILFKRSENMSDPDINELLKKEGYTDDNIKEAFDALDEDVIITVKSLPYLTPMFPVTYKIGIHKIEKRVDILNGIMRKTFEIAVRTIDKIDVKRTIISADISVIHANDSIIKILAISPKDAKNIEKLFCSVIESQRRSVINVAQDL